MIALPLSNNYTDVQAAVLNLKAFEGMQACPYTFNDRPLYEEAYTAIPGDAVNPCRLYNNAGTFQTFGCPNFYGLIPDASACTSTNTADGVALAGGILKGDYSSTSLPPASWPDVRPQALPVLILLSDGVATTAHDQLGGRLCPGAESGYAWIRDGHHIPCRDNDVLKRHCASASDLSCSSAIYPPGTINVIDPDSYDVDDRARDMFDIVSANGSLIFTLGMGSQVKAHSNPWVDIHDLAPGEMLLQYGAFGTTNDMTNPNALLGQYYYDADAAGLNSSFLDIANRLIADHGVLHPTPTVTATMTITPTETMTPTVTPTETFTLTPTLSPLYLEIVSPFTDGQVITSTVDTNFEAVAWDPNIDTTNGTGISKIDFTFSGPSLISPRTDTAVKYCGISGSSTCATMTVANFAALLPGTYTITAKATASDGSGRTATTSKTFVIPPAQINTVTPTRTITPTAKPTRTATKTVTLTPTRTPTKTATPLSLAFNSVPAQDGWILESSATSYQGGWLNSTGNTLQFGDDVANRQYRSILSFNTAALPDNAIIRSAVLRMKYSSLVGSNPFNSFGSLWTQIKQGAFNNNPSLELADFTAAPSSALDAGTFSGPVNAWYSAVLTSTGRTYLNRTGTTQFRLRFATDSNNNNTPDTMRFLSGEYSANPPELVITYTLP